ncbi:putative diguanylate cyclase YcdT [Oxobacter pfennigii]|uniref:Putative diguanylate cyclase YcdT n=1 Tax=Oxobacter pfennigii TaxID=36849 RepID=A0A0N8NSR5_9CLOT|nr:GGDEF domain-containing protein [Oxobacter pfennigii]KPU42768.1 putative diguanylate cyclase YcdT [Oxobacter pfennigii]
MRWCFYKSAPAIISASGFIFSLFIYMAVKYLPPDADLLLWATVIFTQTLSGLMFGLLIKKLHDRSNSDSLTGLKNRRYFYNRLAHEMGRLKKVKSSVSLAVIDVDNFKNINDTYGHVEGDRVLAELASIFKTHARAKDIVVRWGGEEFAIILPDTDCEGAKAYAERIRSVVENHSFPCKVTICIGITCTEIDMDMDKFVAMADQALYKAKEKKNRVVSMKGQLLLK